MAIIISSQVKIPTIVLLAPLVLGFPLFRLKLDNERFVRLLIASMLAVLFYVLTKIEIQPWYFLWILPFAVLIKPNKYIVSLIIGFSLGLLLRYTVFLYFGNWDGIALMLRNSFTIVATITPLLLVLIWDKFVRKLL